MKRHTQWLVNHGACSEAVKWVETQDSMQDAWNNCHRADWMLWLMRAAKVQDDKLYRLFACWCVRNTPLADGRKVWDLLTDKRSQNAVEVSERFANGEATRADLMADAAADADAADADAAAAYAAAAAAAYAAADAAAAYAAARSNALLVQANHLRTVVPQFIIPE